VKNDREGFGEWLYDELERINPSDLTTALFRDRPYDGQPHTDLGERGKQLVRGLTMRDVRDCFVRACFFASGLPREKYPKSLYELPWESIDPLAVCQSMLCEVEKMMGIYPNVPPGKCHRGSL